MPQINPMFDNIIISTISVPKKTESGIILSSSTTAEKPAVGIVKAVGIGKRSPDGSIQKMYVAVGDKVTFNSKAGAELVAGGEKFTIMKEDDILAIITE